MSGKAAMRRPGRSNWSTVGAAACLTAALLLHGCGQAPQRPATPGPVPPAPVPSPSGAATAAEVSAVEQRLIEETNAFRRANRLTALRPSARLINIAQAHARNMARQDRYGDSDKNGHVLDGHSIEYRIKTGGYAFARVTENVGFQLNRKDAVASMMDGWKRSPGHRRNMLEADVIEFGVGVAQGRSGRWYFVQVFGRPASSAQAAAVSG